MAAVESHPSLLPRFRLLSWIPAWAFAGIYLLVVGTAIFILRSQWAYDDPFITYRYADNLVSGVGFVYNPGERILSTTTPLFTLLLASIALIWKDIPLAANLIGAISIAAGALLIFDIAFSLQSPVVGWVALFLYPTFTLLLDTVGSETPLYITLCLAAFAFYYRRQYTYTALVAAATVLARPDGILVVGLLVIDYLFFHRHANIPFKPIAIFSLILIVWIFFAWIYFGSPIPATLAAKQHQGLMQVSQRFPAGLARIAKNHLAFGFGWIQLGLASIGIIYFMCCARKWMLLLTWPLAIILAYSLLGVTSYFWYYAPLIPAFTILIGLGLTGLFQFATSWVDRIQVKRTISKSLAAILFGISIFFISAPQAYSAATQSQRIDPRYRIYRDLGLWLRKHTSPDATVGGLEVGIIGYYARRPMLDFAGLIQPQVALFLDRDTTYQDSARFAIDRYQPDYVVLNTGAFQGIEIESLIQRCQVVKRFKGSEYGYDSDLQVFACKKH